MRPSMRRTRPSAGLKSARRVSMRPEVHSPPALRRGVMRRLPEPSRLMLAGSEVYRWISPVAQLAGPPGQPWPVSMIQSLDGGSEPEVRVQSSAQTRDQPDGVGGTEAEALVEA